MGIGVGVVLFRWLVFGWVVALTRSLSSVDYSTGCH
ncbi:hypothetical protein RSAG8_03353, partial [Rhizoctonia solani AG-8 WAC10335]